MDRRRFLALSSAAFLAQHLPLRTFGLVRSPYEPAESTVFETSCVTYESLTSVFDAAGGLQTLLPVDPRNATIVLKPNLCLPDGPAKATTTSPNLVELICRKLIAHGAKKIIIADHTLQRTPDFERTPWPDLPRKYPEVKLLLANEERFYEPLAVDGRVLKQTDILRVISKADLFINIPTAKHHSATHVSLGLKNLMGTIWNRSDFHSALDLDKAVADLATVVRPTLTIVDASRVLLRGGPTGPGPILTENRLFASHDILAVDAIVSSRYSFGGMSLSPSRIPHLAAALELGVGELDPDRIRVEKV
jgi:uncharacterized protein (DUF362 family)